MRTFTLVRYEDESGVSGTGVVARGCEYPTGRCVIEWCAPDVDVRSMTIFASVEECITIHGHGGKTELVWDDAA